ELLEQLDGLLGADLGVLGGHGAACRVRGSARTVLRSPAPTKPARVAPWGRERGAWGDEVRGSRLSSRAFESVVLMHAGCGALRGQQGEEGMQGSKAGTQAHQSAAPSWVG